MDRCSTTEPVIGVWPGTPGTGPSQQVIELGTSHPHVVLEVAAIQKQLL